MSADAVLIRRVETQAEYDECVRIEDEIWGSGFNERVPTTILRVSQYLGGVTAAAFEPDDGRMLGFVFGMTGVQDGRLVHWSDLLAVRREARDRGLGRRLKLFQRSLVIPLGVTRMLWTFDPLVARNAHLNLNALGASVTEYIPDMYGSDTGSSLHSSVGTDRFVVAWDLTREPGAPRDGAGAELLPADSLVVNPMEPERTGASLRTGDTLREAYVVIPGDIQQVIATAPEKARAWRERTREAFLWYLGQGHRVTGFHRAGDHGFYHLSRPRP
jgi:predicted GNAT superfamily acetyltransferase